MNTNPILMGNYDPPFIFWWQLITQLGEIACHILIETLNPDVSLWKTISWWTTMAHLDEVTCPIPMGRPWNIFIGDLIFPILAGYSPWPTLLKSHALFWWDTIYTGIPQSSSWLDSIYPILVICLLRPIIDVSVPILVGPHTLVYPHDPTWWNVMSFCGVPLWPILMGYYVPEMATSSGA